MGLVVGSGREYAMSELTRERLFMFWELADDLLNLILFGMVGLELTALAGTVREYLLPAAAALPIVLIARYVSVGVPVALLQPLPAVRAAHGEADDLGRPARSAVQSRSRCRCRRGRPRS